MKTKIKDGGSAFPWEYKNDDMRHHRINYPGMSIRDYFAAQAMAGIFANDESAHSPENLDEVVAWCYAVADAMLAAREEHNGQ